MGRVTLTRQPDLVQLEREHEIKVQVCRAIDRVAGRYGMTQKELAMILGTSRSCVSRMMNRKVEDLSFNQLFRFAIRLAPYFKILIAV
ncbi:MAG: XRE family transcriptional regulator [Bdellovibrionales bacterium]